MYAVIKTGGKQYKVSAGDVVAVERLTAAPGTSVTFSEVLMIGDEASQTIGTPLVDGVTVTAEVLDQARAGKIVVFKKKRRKHYRRTAGHRQHLTMLRITDVAGQGAPKPAAKTSTDTDTETRATPAASQTASDEAEQAGPAAGPAPTETAKPTAKQQRRPKKSAKGATKKAAAKTTAAKSAGGKRKATKKSTKKSAKGSDGD